MSRFNGPVTYQVGDIAIVVDCCQLVKEKEVSYPLSYFVKSRKLGFRGRVWLSLKLKQGDKTVEVANRKFSISSGVMSHCVMKLYNFQFGILEFELQILNLQLEEC